VPQIMDVLDRNEWGSAFRAPEQSPAFARLGIPELGHRLGLLVLGSRRPSDQYGLAAFLAEPLD
jgi:hypothetical protein